MKIKFLGRRVVQDEHRHTARATVFEAGQVIDLPETSARRWIARGAAEPVIDKPEPTTTSLSKKVRA